MVRVEKYIQMQSYILYVYQVFYVFLQDKAILDALYIIIAHIILGFNIINILKRPLLIIIVFLFNNFCIYMRQHRLKIKIKYIISSTTGSAYFTK